MALSLSAALASSSQHSAHALSCAGPGKRGSPSRVGSSFCTRLKVWSMTVSNELNDSVISARILIITATSEATVSTGSPGQSDVMLFLPSGHIIPTEFNKKAQLSLTNPRDAKACQNCSNSTCLQRCRWQYWPIFMRLTAIASEIREIPRNSLKI